METKIVTREVIIKNLKESDYHPVLRRVFAARG